MSFQNSNADLWSLQGIFIFILYVVLNDNLKKVWRKLLNIADADKPSHSSVPYSRSKGKLHLQRQYDYRLYIF